MASRPAVKARRLQRGHITDRVETARQLFSGDKPLALKQFFEEFFQNDITVIMLNAENTHGKSLPKYIAIDNPGAQLFPCGSLIGWQHRKAEVDFLRQLFKDQGEANPVNAGPKKLTAVTPMMPHHRTKAEPPKKRPAISKK